jgi:hypothetical protein
VLTTTILLIKATILAAHTMINLVQLADYMTLMISLQPENAVLAVEEALDITLKEDLVVILLENLLREQDKEKEDGIAQWAHFQQELELNSSKLLHLEMLSNQMLGVLSLRNSITQWILQKEAIT